MANKYAFGTQGNDHLSHYGTQSYVAYGYGGNDTLDGNSNNDSLYGGSGSDKLYGRGGNDYLVGNGGKDYFDGGSGSDTVSYHYYSGNVSASLTTDTATFSTSPYSEKLISIENLTGGTGNDSLFGDSGKNTLNGGGGNDYLVGNGGQDYFNGGSGSDTVSYHYYSGDVSADLITDTATFSTSPYSEKLISIENLTGGTGNDSLFGDSGKNTLNGYSGNDYLYGRGGDDILYGGTGNDKLYGGTGNDKMKGYGHSSHEYDTLAGGSGSDTFIIGDSYSVFYEGAGFATITDWDASSDFIQAQGSSSQYSFGTRNWSGSSALDTEIFFGNDLIAVVEDTTNVSFSRDFNFV